MLLQSRPVSEWGAQKVTRLLEQELGLHATFDVQFRAIPLSLELSNLTVPSAEDPSGPAVYISELQVTPRLFSLLAGRFDAGDIEIGPSRIVVRIQDGQVQNFSFRLPQTKGDSKFSLERAPFRSLAWTSAELDIALDGRRIRTEQLDLDISASDRLTFDVALRLGGATVQDHTYRVVRDPNDPEARVLAEDQLCALDLRARVTPSSLTVQRFSLLAAPDLDDSDAAHPHCGGRSENQLALRLTQLSARFPEQRLSEVRGGVFLRAPVKLAARYLKLPGARGAAGFSGELSWRVGARLPEVDGQLHLEDVNLGKYRVAEELSADVRVSSGGIFVPELHADWANGHLDLEGVELHPFAGAGDFSIRRMESKGIDFPGVMRDLGVAPHTIVDWRYDSVLASQIHGTLKPFSIDGAMNAQTSNFTVWNKGHDHPERKRMIGVTKAHLSGRFRANAEVFEVYSTLAEFGSSHMPVELVSVGLGGGSSPIKITLGKGAILELADVSPVANLPLSGRTHLNLSMGGPMNHPTLQGSLAVDGLRLANFDVGNLTVDDVHFEPLRVQLKGAQGIKNALAYRIPQAEFRFDGQAPFELMMQVSSERLSVPELMRTLRFSEDPRFQDIAGRGSANAEVRYVLGGSEDVCDGGRLKIEANMNLSEFLYDGERYGPASGGFRLDWFDIEAGTRGMDLWLDGLRLGKGSGSVYGNAHVSADAKLEGNFLATRIPVARIDALGSAVAQVEGYVTGRATVDGSLDAMHLLAHTELSELRVSAGALPPSQLDVEFIPHKTTFRGTGETSGCKRAIAAEFSTDAYQADESDGEILLRGSLFGGQIATDNLRITRQRKRVISGALKVKELNLGALASLTSVDGTLPFRGTISGSVDVERFSAVQPFDSKAEVHVTGLRLERGGYVAESAPAGAHISLGPEGLRLDNTSLSFQAPGQEQAAVAANALLGRDLSLVATVRMPKTPLATFLSPLESVREAEGTLEAGLDVTGTLSAPTFSGYLEVEDGKLELADLRTPLTDIGLRVQVNGKGVEIESGHANLGGGSLALSGGAPLVQGTLGNGKLNLVAKGVALPLGNDFRTNLDANLSLDVPRAEKKLPKLSGRIDVDSAHYERVMSMTADLSSLGSRAKKSDVVDANPEDASLEFDVIVFGRRPLQVKNELVEVGLAIDPSGVRISGTDQKFGAVGNVKVASGGHIYLRQNVFEVQNGIVRFSDALRLRPEVDVTATSEFRRNQGVNAFGSSAQTQAGVSSSGNYRVALHAYGEPEDLKIDMTSDPPLAQDDIFLLLTIGLTRRELDRTQSSGVGSSAALEALGSLTGAESAVSNVVKVDDFRFGSTYSSRTGRTEPTVTIGKRLGDRLRASVTSSISEANELRSNVEYQATPHLSLEGSYDNAQRSGGPTMGNIGGDVRWRLEFD